MVNYNKSIIYKICCNDLKIKELYIGSTTNFTRRKNSHKTACNNINDRHYNIKVYKFIRDNGGWSNWSMILIDNVSCESKLELLKIEREYVEKNNSILNCYIPSRTNKEYYQTNREQLLDYHMKYRQDNKEQIQKYKNEWNQKNKKHIQEYNNEWYQKNKKQILEKSKEK